MASQQEDNEIIERYKKTGEISLIGELFTRYTSLVYGVCLKYLKERELAKDAVMQIFEKLMSSLKNHEVENFKGWLYVTARNYCLMELRSKKNKFTEEISARVVENSLFLHHEPENDLENNLDKLEKCIDKLVEGQKQCVRLFYLHEKCYKEVATDTGYELTQVKSFIQNGKRNLKLCMEENE